MRGVHIRHVSTCRRCFCLRSMPGRKRLSNCSARIDGTLFFRSILGRCSHYVCSLSGWFFFSCIVCKLQSLCRRFFPTCIELWRLRTMSRGFLLLRSGVGINRRTVHCGSVLSAWGVVVLHVPSQQLLWWWSYHLHRLRFWAVCFPGFCELHDILPLGTIRG